MEQLDKDQLTFVLDCMIDDDDDVMYDVLKDSDGEEELVLELLATREKRKDVARDVPDPAFSKYTDEEFLYHFRVQRSLFESLTKKFEATEQYQSLRPDKRCSASKHIAVFLWFAGHEMCSFRHLAKRFDLSISTVCAITERTVNFISNLSSSEIKWPSEEEMQQSSFSFASKSGFAKAFGCIDLTHIAIDRGNECDDGYIDRNGNVSVCLQAICNEKRKFINVFVGHPGSTHDSTVYQNSPIYQKINNECGDYYLLGDLGYPCSSNLVTPYRDVGYMTSAQRQFNEKLNSARVTIEHTISILKQRFPQLNCVKLRDMSKLCHFVRACCVLHNIADEDDLDFTLSPISEAPFEYMQHGETARGNTVRDAICLELQETPKPTNKKQMEILAAFMAANPDLAKSRNIKTQADRWQELSNDLNRHGPPVRSWGKWTKIWTSLKYQIKKKKAENEQRMNTLGPPKKLVKYTEFEETVLTLLEEDPLALDQETSETAHEPVVAEPPPPPPPKVTVKFIEVKRLRRN